MKFSQDVLFRITFYLAIGSAAAILLSIALSQILLGLALGLLLISGAKMRLPRIWLPIALYMVGTVIALVFSPEPMLGLPQIRKFFVWTMLLVVFSTVRDVLTARRLFLGWSVLGALVALRGIVQYANKVQQASAQHEDFYKFYVGDRITGFMSHWMTFAGQEMVVLLMLTAFLFFGPVVRRQWLWILCAGLLAVAEVLNETRTIWLALAVSGFWLLWWWRKSLAIAVPIVCVAVVWLAPGDVHDRFMSIFKPKKDLDSNEFRALTFRTGLRMIEAHPLLGIGPEGVKYHFMDWLPPDTPRPLPSGWFGHLHNFYLQYAAERGIPTMLFMLWMLIMILYDFGRALRRLPPGRSDARFLLQGGIAVVAGIMISGIFENNLGDTEVLTVFLVVVACGYLASEQSLLALKTGDPSVLSRSTMG